MADLTSLQLDIDLTQRRPLRDETYVVIRRAILDGALKPGEYLNERALAEQLGLSRSPVREALRRLEQEGLVALVRQRMVVQELSFEKVLDLYQVRQPLEALVARLAAQRSQPEDLARLTAIMAEATAACAAKDDLRVREADVDFHETLADIAGNQLLTTLLASLTAEIHRFRNLHLANSTRGQESLDEHRQILDAVAAKDEDRAAALMHTHITHALNYAKKLEQQRILSAPSRIEVNS
jgi:DNA-binding GntR family transcriptional regulator